MVNLWYLPSEFFWKRFNVKNSACLFSGRALKGVMAFLLALLVPVTMAAEPASAARQPANADSVARLMAGLEPSDSAHKALAESKVWQTHSAAMIASWTKVRDGQLAGMQAWRSKELPGGCPVGNTLLYPFSGPDFLNAFALFPACTTTVMFGLEPVGRLPDPSAMNSAHFAQSLTAARNAMANIFERNYFVTNTMRRNLHGEQLRGVVPVLTMSMVYAGLEVVSVQPAPMVKPGGDKAKINGVSIEYRSPGGKGGGRVLYYPVDLSDKGLSGHPEALDYIRGFKPSTTLLKAASYLMHIREFSQIRQALLETSGFLLQDDTGIPYRHLVKQGFAVTPYGTYKKPIPPFEPQYQQSLMDFYRSSQPQALPFRFGYHTSLAENRSVLMIARLKPQEKPVSAGDAASGR